MLVYAPDLSVKWEGGQNDKYNASSNSQIEGFDTFDWTWKQKIMDSGASLSDIRNKNLAVEKKELELISKRNDLLIEAADAYLGLNKASEKKPQLQQRQYQTDNWSRGTRVQVGSGLASDFLKQKDN